LFLLMTGLSASVVRAALVTLLSLLAWYYGRTLRPLLLIALVAAVTALWNPLYLWSDVGWYLSFLAFFGVLILAPLLNKRFFGTTEPRAIAGLLTETTSALLLTIPFVLYIFSQISLIAMVANMLVVPLVPLAMLLSLIAGLAGMLVPVLGGWLALPANYLLTYLLDLVQLISRWPYVLIKRQLPLFGMLFLYGCLMGVMVSLWHKQRQTGKITEIETEHPVERTFQMVND
ncbi:MAG TPA: ComEC/Rec2 family competence protein, partial [Patescibacteria group bacterium]|nr:ComEC/Rec2 family competence protein [Patescibacteria group bacterium]